MISIIQHIQYLIVCHDCVVVPGLGAFVAQHIPASISPDGCSILPPSRELSFNPLLTHDDGLLVNSITRREGVSYECGRSAVSREVELIHRRLRHEGTLLLERIGTLTLSGHGLMEFTPVRVNGVANLAYRGLYEVAARPLAPTRSDGERTTVMDSVTELSVRNRVRGLMRYAASAVILLGLGAVMMTPVSVPENFSFASLKPTTPSVVERVFTDPAPMAESDREIVLYRAGEDGRAEVTPRAVVESAEKVVAPARYYVIVASTSSLKEARRFVRMHSTKKYPLAILPSDGRYRVYAASGNDMARMSAFRKADANFAASHPDAWIYTLK